MSACLEIKSHRKTVLKVPGRLSGKQPEIFHIDGDYLGKIVFPAKSNGKHIVLIDFTSHQVPVYV